jgi:hypothetical protein
MRPGITSITEENSTHILTTDDVGKLIICNNVAGCEITVPTNTLPLNSIFYFISTIDNQQVILIEDIGVTIHSPTTALKSRDQYSTIFLQQISTNIFLLGGDLEPDAP